MQAVTAVIPVGKHGHVDQNDGGGVGEADGLAGCLESLSSNFTDLWMIPVVAMK